MAQPALADSFAADLWAAAPFLRRVGRGLARRADEAEELVQDTLLQAWRRRDQFQPGSNLRAWLYVILRNRFHSRPHRRWRALTEFSDERALDGLAAPDTAAARLQVSELRRALAALPAAQRQAVLLVSVQGLSYEAAARAMGCPAATAKTRVFRAREALHARLGEGARRSPA